MRWGLIPAWAKDPTIGTRLINARAETLAEKPSFRGAYRYRRCLIPATGYYEWQSLGRGKQPHYIHLQEHGLFAMRGLWESWQDIETCTIITTAANTLTAGLHDRMPVILSRDAWDVWLDTNNSDTHILQALLTPYLSEEMAYYPVSKAVNRATYEGPDCLLHLAQT